MTLNQMRDLYKELYDRWKAETDDVKRDDLWDEMDELRDAMTEAKEGR